MPISNLTYVFAQSSGEWLMPVMQTAKTLGIVLALIVSTAAIVYSVFNRKKYDGLNESIKEQAALIEIKNARIETITEEHKAALAELNLKLTEAKNENKALKHSNQIVVSANLQSMAILKKLRNAGLWDGDETNVFRDSMYDAERK